MQDVQKLCRRIKLHLVSPQNHLETHRRVERRVTGRHKLARKVLRHRAVPPSTDHVCFVQDAYNYFMAGIKKFIRSTANGKQWSVQPPGQYTTHKWLLNNGTISCECTPDWHTRSGLPPVVWCAEGDFPPSLFTAGSFLDERERENTVCW
jgi:hypothetical protein